MSSSKIKNLLIGVCLIVAGFGSAFLSFRTQILIDYDSGNLRQRMLIGPCVVRDELLRSALLQSYPLPSGNPSLKGRPAWHTVAVFPWNSTKSANYVAGQVLNDANRLAAWFPSMDKREAGFLKEGFLMALARGGESESRRFVIDAETRLRDHLGAEIGVSEAAATNTPTTPK